MAPNKTNSNKAPHPNITARVLPHNAEAEQAVLGCVLIDEFAPVHILSELKEEDFYINAHKTIFSAMRTIMEKDKPIDIIMLISELDSLGQTDSVGGITYLTTLSNFVPSASNYVHYTGIVKKNAILRSLILSAQKITDRAFAGEDDALKFAEGEIYSLAEKMDKSSLSHIRPALDEAVGKIETMYKTPDAGKGIPTGFKRLNMLLNGLQPSDLILIAARPGQGKTSIGMNMITNAALNNDRRTEAGKKNPYKCAVFSLEMPAAQLAKRILCGTAKVDMTHANSGKLNQEEWKKLYNAKSLLDKSDIYIDDSSLTTPIEILSKCRRLKREKGLDLVMIDYLQLMSSGKRVESRQQEISEITRTMKIAAKELNVPILLLSQLSREVEKRADKKPQMSDLRESGAIEQDADIIMFIYREHDPHDQSIDAELRNKSELIIAKHRNGETGRIELRWRGEYVSFEDVDNSEYLEKSAPPESGGSGNFIMDNAPPPSPPVFGVEDDSDMYEMKTKSTEEIMQVKKDSDESIW